MTEMKEKACKSCRKIKPAGDFYENKFSPDGRYAFCKVCFDQFAKKLKEKEKASAPLNKTCQKCGMVKLIDAFDGADDHQGAGSGWCIDCRQAPKKPPTPKTEKEKKQDAAPQKVSSTKARSPQKKQPKAPKTVEPPAIKEPLPPEPDARPAPEQIQTEAPAPVPETVPEPVDAPADDFDFIEYLLESQSLEKKAALEKLQVPKQITKIKARKRICNGCRKTEEIDQVERNTVIPVHAWFCGLCREREVKRPVRKGFTVYDYWGREFKVKKIISSDIITGVLKDKNGKWEKRPLQIFGSWEKP